ncbi:MAG: glycerol kinase GlpK [Pirellulaceae bacterium]|nr:glycerol kinase GlpK [Pirellulaceae bacterium]
MTKYVLAFDQGTTSSRAMVFDHQGQNIGVAQREFKQILPSPGMVEHNPIDIWETQYEVAVKAIEKAGQTAESIAAIGITNQRETTILWDRQTGEPVDNAIVWQSRISAGICDQLRREGYEDTFREKTGLLLDSYFSGTKVKYLLDKHEGLRERAARGEILFGTVDTYLIWRLTEGKTHITDMSNASRTLMFNLHTLDWDDELLKILGIPRAMLPEVGPSSGKLGEATVFGKSIPITGCAGDQQAALFGQACFHPGLAKNTYGTGCFLLMNTGDQPIQSGSNLLTTIGWSIDGKVTYCLEGSVFIGGAVVQWLRDGLGLIKSSEEIEQLVANVSDTEGVYLVPAFVGLGAPYWDPYARGTIVGLSRGTTAGHLGLAALESMAFQSRDVLQAMETAAGVKLDMLKVDGGASVNNRLLQFQSDILGVTVQRPTLPETTALGAAYLAGIAIDYWEGIDVVEQHWQLDQEFTPQMASDERETRYHRWQEAVKRSMGWQPHEK